jgi:hypothetical protein
MNSSAKLTAVLLAATALGVAVFSGCTVNSTSDSNTDGGATSGSSSGGTSGTARNDAGDSGPVLACEGNKQVEGVVSTECQTCLEQNCCAQLKGCFNIEVPDSGDKVDCETYSACLSQCAEENPNDQKARQDCEQVCELSAAEGVSDAYDKIITCGEGSCQTVCGL